MRVFGLALAGVLALTTPIPAHADQPASKMRSAGPAPGIAQGTAEVRAGLRYPRGAVAGARIAITPANGDGTGLARIGRRTIFTAFGVRLRHGVALTLYGAAPTFPIATTVTGARCGIPTRNGEARTEAGVIPNGLG